MAYDTHTPPMGARLGDPDIHRARQERFGNGAGPGYPPARDRSFVGLLRDLRDESISLIQEEVSLARTEIQEKISEARAGAVSMATGAAVLAAGLLMLLFAAAAGLYAAMLVMEVSPMIAGWLAPLIVGAIVAIIGGALLAAGKRKVEPSNLRPERTERSLRETGAWAERKV